MMRHGSAMGKAKLNSLVHNWIGENYEMADGVCLPRCTLYEHFLDFSQEADISPMNAASFGKCVRFVFPNVTIRRLGTRGQSKYHYYGLTVKRSSKYYHAVVKMKEQERLLASGQWVEKQEEVDVKPIVSHHSATYSGYSSLSSHAAGRGGRASSAVAGAATAMDAMPHLEQQYTQPLHPVASPYSHQATLQLSPIKLHSPSAQGQYPGAILSPLTALTPQAFTPDTQGMGQPPSSDVQTGFPLQHTQPSATLEYGATMTSYAHTMPRMTSHHHRHQQQQQQKGDGASPLLLPGHHHQHQSSAGAYRTLGQQPMVSVGSTHACPTEDCFLGSAPATPYCQPSSAFSSAPAFYHRGQSVFSSWPSLSTSSAPECHSAPPYYSHNVSMAVLDQSGLHQPQPTITAATHPAMTATTPVGGAVPMAGSHSPSPSQHCSDVMGESPTASAPGSPPGLTHGGHTLPLARPSDIEYGTSSAFSNTLLHHHGPPPS